MSSLTITNTGFKQRKLQSIWSTVKDQTLGRLLKHVLTKDVSLTSRQLNKIQGKARAKQFKKVIKDFKVLIKGIDENTSAEDLLKRLKSLHPKLQINFLSREQIEEIDKDLVAFHLRPVTQEEIQWVKQHHPGTKGHAFWKEQDRNSKLLKKFGIDTRKHNIAIPDNEQALMSLLHESIHVLQAKHGIQSVSSDFFSSVDEAYTYYTKNSNFKSYKPSAHSPAVNEAIRLIDLLEIEAHYLLLNSNVLFKLHDREFDNIMSQVLYGDAVKTRLLALVK